MPQLALRMLHVLPALVAFTSVDSEFGSLDIEHRSLQAQARTTPHSLSPAKPRLSWRLTSTNRGDYQSAYHIQVASSRQLLDEGVDLWDSGPVRSSHQCGQRCVYAGQPLRSRVICWWRVRAWDAAGRASAAWAWSDVTTFELKCDHHRVAMLCRATRSLPVPRYSGDSCTVERRQAAQHKHTSLTLTGCTPVQRLSSLDSPHLHGCHGE